MSIAVSIVCLLLACGLALAGPFSPVSGRLTLGLSVALLAAWSAVIIAAIAGAVVASGAI
jgi:hypothetical protein